MHRQKHLRLQTSGLLCWFNGSNIRSHHIICSLVIATVGVPQLDIMRRYVLFILAPLHGLNGTF